MRLYIEQVCSANALKRKNHYAGLMKEGLSYICKWFLEWALVGTKSNQTSKYE
jgi:hypothetical protein